MKKLLLLALAAVLMAGCTPVMKTDHYTNEGLEISIIDSCEYIHYSCGWGPEYTHKGNCKYCEQRRQREIREIINELRK